LHGIAAVAVMLSGSAAAAAVLQLLLVRNLYYNQFSEWRGLVSRVLHTHGLHVSPKTSGKKEVKELVASGC